MTINFYEWNELMTFTRQQQIRAQIIDMLLEDGHSIERDEQIYTVNADMRRHAKECKDMLNKLELRD